MRRRSIDDTDIGIIDQRNRFPCPVVLQAQEDDIRRIEKLPALFIVMSFIFIDSHQLQIFPGSDPVKNLQTGRPRLSVDIYFRLSHFYVLSLITHCRRFAALTVIITYFERVVQPGQEMMERSPMQPIPAHPAS
jgi:hypothetical protein